MSERLADVVERVVYTLLQQLDESDVEALMSLDERLHGTLAPWDPDFERLAQARVEWCVLEAPWRAVAGASPGVHMALRGELPLDVPREELRLAGQSFESVFMCSPGGGVAFDLLAGGPVVMDTPLHGIDGVAAETAWTFRAVPQGDRVACVHTPLPLPRGVSEDLSGRRHVGWLGGTPDPRGRARRLRRTWGRDRRRDG